MLNSGLQSFLRIIVLLNTGIVFNPMNTIKFLYYPSSIELKQIAGTSVWVYMDGVEINRSE